MTSRELRHALALPVLVATLLCVVLPAPVMSKSGQADGKSQRQDSGYQGSKGKRDDSNGQRDNGGNRGDNSGRGHSNQKNQRPDDNYDRKAQRSQSLSPQQAAQRARSQYGGQVLKVQPSGGGYQVRLLKEDGRVVTVPIGD